MAAKAVMLRRVDPAVILAKVQRGWGFPITAAPAGKGGKSGGDGGLGEHSFAVAYAGKPVTKMGKTTLKPGAKGAGGMSGSNTMTNAGGDGVAIAEQVFP